MSADNEKFADVRITLFADPSQPLPAATRILPWDKTKPCRHLPTRFEEGGIGDRGRERARGDRPYTRNSLQHSAPKRLGRALKGIEPLPHFSVGATRCLGCVCVG